MKKLQNATRVKGGVLMNVKGLLDRKLMLMVLSPVARAVLSLAAGYLSAKGVPADMVNELTTLVGAGSVVGFNICWELIDRKRAVVKGQRLVIDEIMTGAAR